jgi:hypothetical protein
MLVCLPDPSGMEGIELTVTFAGRFASYEGVLLYCMTIIDDGSGERVSDCPDAFLLPDFGVVNWIPLRRADGWTSSSSTPVLGNSVVINGKTVLSYDYPSVTVVSNGSRWIVTQRQQIERQN